MIGDLIRAFVEAVVAREAFFAVVPARDRHHARIERIYMDSDINPTSLQVEWSTP